MPCLTEELKIVIFTMIASLLMCVVSVVLIRRQNKTLTFKDLDDDFLLVVAYTTAIYMLFLFGACGFFFWPTYYAIEFVFKFLSF